MAPSTRSQTAKARLLQQPDSTLTSARVPESPPCRLLDLSGELRNRIYRFVLVDPDQQDIPITVDGYARPDLLSTCKQIRQEALKIYLYENNFRFDITHFNPLAMQRFYGTLPQMGIPSKSSIQVHLSDDGHRNPSWPNLTTWLYEYYHRRVDMNIKYPKKLEGQGVRCVGDNVKFYIIGAMFETVSTMRKTNPWSVVKSTIEISRPTLISLDQQWAED